MNPGLLKLLNKFFLSAVKILGFSAACFISGCKKYGGPEDPYALFVVNGNIEDAVTGNPIENICINVSKSNPGIYNTGLSEADGSYSVTMHDDPVSQTYVVTFTDTDSAQHGNYSGKDTTVTFAGDQLSGNDDSYLKGTDTLRLDIRLNPK